MLPLATLIYIVIYKTRNKTRHSLIPIMNANIKSFKTNINSFILILLFLPGSLRNLILLLFLAKAQQVSELGIRSPPPFCFQANCLLLLLLLSF